MTRTTARTTAQATARAQTPADIYGPLFVAVQEQRVFGDGKTFVDAVPKRDPAAIMAAYRAAVPTTKQALRRFVLANFAVPGIDDASPTDIATHIRQLWPTLTRPPIDPPVGSSALALPAPYVVPGGRFREIYYWDSFFTMLGLRVDEQQPLVESMIDDFVSLIERHGHIPNGTRTYYLSRSQPPFFALMLDLSTNADPVIARRRLAALRIEHDFWMKGRACLNPSGACDHVARMPDGSILNRYWDARDTPRDESFAEDRATAAASGRDARIVQRDLRSAAESGWDFSSRWLTDPQKLTTIHTTDIVPIDLNSLLYAMERRIADRCAAVADQPCARDFTAQAKRRKAAIDKYLWLKPQGRYVDWDRTTRAATPVVSAATLYPLFVGLAAPAQAKAVATTTRATLLGQGGLRTTTLRTGQQWDDPNGWAPLQWIAVDGLARYGEDALARDIARRWIATVTRSYRETGKMLEKYDVAEQTAGGGGEYPTQDGFGWTNGVTGALMARYPDLVAAPPPAAED
ncbi:MAG: alpha,alpha-trehalase TreF [Sphingomonas bacterium]|nr:alpha,alpha-trehalase TreF [Sphingomonas bacterium]